MIGEDDQQSQHTLEQQILCKNVRQHHISAIQSDLKAYAKS